MGLSHYIGGALALPPPARQRQIIANAAARFGIDPSILYGVYGAETNFGHNIGTSSAGATGPFQFMPATAQGLGIDPNNFRQAAFGAARYLSQYKDRGTAGMLAAYNAGPAGNPQNPETQAYIPRVQQLAQQWNGPAGQAPTRGVPQLKVLDQGSYEQAEKRYQLGQLLRKTSSPFQDFGPKASVNSENPLLAALPSEAPDPRDFQQAVSQLSRLAGGLGVKSHPAAGVGNFEGTKVAGWIAPILQYARQQGWKGQITSGFRTFADQKRIYDSGVRPAAKPGTSNHEGTEFPRGAIDVSDAEQLARILARSPYRGRLVWAGSKDPVHFSHPHDGSY